MESRQRRWSRRRQWSDAGGGDGLVATPWAKPPLDKVSLIGLITAIPGLALVSIPLGVWGIIRTEPPAPRSDPGRDQLRADRPVGDRRNHRGRP